MEHGNFDINTEINTGDELEILGKTLDKTAKTLKKIDEDHKQLDHVKTEFLSITSHELRSPMTPMRAQLQMLQGEYFGKLNNKQKESITIILRNTIRLDNIIKDFLEISRIESARLKFVFVKKDLTEPIIRLIEEMNAYLSEKNIKIKLNISKLPIIEIDSDRVMQVLRNLINNAKKFSPINSKINVDVNLNKVFTDNGEHEVIQISVKDQGIGISTEDQRRVFEPFYQAEQTMYREYGGTGLGLAICKGIIESQNGRMWIESEKGKGSTFHFTVPLSPVREGKAIKLLFSNQGKIKENLKQLFTEYLGPLGDSEFKKETEKEDFTKENILNYINKLIKKNIIKKEKGKEFKRRTINIFSGDENDLDPVTEQIKTLLIDIYGEKKGTEEFKNLGDKLEKNVLDKEIDLLTARGKINTQKAKEFKKRLKEIMRND